MLTDLYGAKERKEASQLTYACNAVRHDNTFEDDQVVHKKQTNIGEI